MRSALQSVLLVAALLIFAVPAHAEIGFGFALGGSGAWLDGGTSPSDYEASAHGKASLSPHISLVASGGYGFRNEYAQAKGGVRVTATDANNPNFSIGLGIQYHVSDKPEVRPEGWMPDASIGWRPWPQTVPRLVLVAQGAYGLKNNEAEALAGARFALTKAIPGGAQ